MAWRREQAEIPVPPCRTSGSLTCRWISASRPRSRSRVPSILTWTLPTLTASRSIPVAETSQRGDALDVAIEGSPCIRRHDQVESAVDGQNDPIVRGTFIEEEAARD